jgi:quinolinate synthase
VWKAEHPGAPVVTYVNSSAEVKAESDVCVTSANAVAVVRALDAERILFAPDRNLGSWVARSLPDVEVLLWDGWCPTHDEVTVDHVEAARAEHPDARVMVHPECRPEVVDLADAVLSTSQMLSYAANDPAEEFVVVTESGLVHALQKAAPDKRFFELSPRMLCPNMKLTTLAKVRDALALGQYEINVPDDVASRARSAVERMVAIG